MYTAPLTVHINDTQTHLRCRQGLRHDLLHVERLLQSRQCLLLLQLLRSRPRRRRHRPSQRRRLLLLPRSRKRHPQQRACGRAREMVKAVVCQQGPLDA